MNCDDNAGDIRSPSQPTAEWYTEMARIHRHEHGHWPIYSCGRIGSTDRYWGQVYDRHRYDSNTDSILPR